MTGRGLGNCSNYDTPGLINPAPGCGLGRRFGFRGGGRGWRHEYYATGLPRWARAGNESLTLEQEATALKAQAGRLQSQLDAINKRIENIEQK
jgi:hypothetical protein